MQSAECRVDCTRVFTRNAKHTTCCLRVFLPPLRERGAPRVAYAGAAVLFTSHLRRMTNPSWIGGIPSGLSDCSNTHLDHSLLRQARSRVIQRSCAKGALRSGRAVELFLFESAVWPPEPSPFSASRQTGSWLARLTSGTTIQCGPSVNASNVVKSAPGTLPLLLMDFRWSDVRHLSLNQQQRRSFRKQIRAAYAALAEVAHSLRRQGARPVTLINFGMEAADIAMVRIVENLLSSCGINPSASILLHYGVGAMLPLRQNFMLPHGSTYLSHHWKPLLQWAKANAPPRARMNATHTRLRQAFSNIFWDAMADSSSTGPSSALHGSGSQREAPFVERYRMCDRNGTALRHRVLQRLREPAQKPFLLLGGRAKDERGLITLELQRTGLLDHASWSAGRFGFCPSTSGGPMPQGTLERNLEGKRNDGPFATAQARALLQDELAVRRLCDQLPKVLDVDPTKKLSVTESVRDAGVSTHAIWRGVGVGVILETNIRDALLPDAKETSRPSVVTYVTEKPLKPVLHLRPAVHLGAAGALSVLSSFGLDASFGGLVNTSYDGVLSASARTNAALKELTRLTRLSPHELLNAAPSLADSLVGNMRQLVCGGMQRKMLAHAQEALELADRMERSGFAT